MKIMSDKENVKLSKKDLEKIIESGNITKEERRKLQFKLFLKKILPDLNDINKK